MSNRLGGSHNMASLLKFAFPTIVMMVFSSLYTMADGVIVSRLISTDALSAVNIVFPVINVVYALGVMLATGGSAIVAKKMGEGKTPEANQDFSLLVIAGIAAGIVITIVGLLFIDPIIRFLGADELLYDYCYDYLFPYFFFAVPGVLQMLFQTFFITAGRPALGLYTTVIAGVANVVLDILFVGPLNMGIAGAAIATGLGYCLPALAGLLWFSLKRGEPLHFRRPVWRGKILIQACGNGASEMVTQISSAIVTLLFNIVMMREMGSAGVAAITIVLYGDFFLIAVFLGFSTGIAPVVSFNFGERNRPELKKLFWLSTRFLIVVSIATFVACFFFAEPIARVFSSRGTAVYTLAVHGMQLYAYSFLLKGFNIYASSLFTALSDGATSAFLSFMRTLVFLVIGILALPLVLGIDGVWLAVPFAELLSIVLSLYFCRRLFSQNWRLD